jgi:hypothetical protein
MIVIPSASIAAPFVGLSCFYIASLICLLTSSFPRYSEYFFTVVGVALLNQNNHQFPEADVVSF